MNNTDIKTTNTLTTFVLFVSPFLLSFLHELMLIYILCRRLSNNYSIQSSFHSKPPRKSEKECF